MEICTRTVHKIHEEMKTSDSHDDMYIFRQDGISVM